MYLTQALTGAPGKSYSHYDWHPQVRSGFEVNMEVKELFFDQPAVERMMDADTHKAMRIAASQLRLIAQHSMRYAPMNRVSPPGSPPFAHKPHSWIRKFIWFYYDPHLRTAVVGPIRLPNSSDAPHSLEFGTTTCRIVNKRRTLRRVGGAGEIRVSSDFLWRRQAMSGTRIANWYRTPMRNVDVWYAHLYTQQQADRANQINEALYGPSLIGGTLEARPFMGPALAKVAPVMPEYWGKSAGGGEGGGD